MAPIHGFQGLPLDEAPGFLDQEDIGVDSSRTQGELCIV